MSIDDTTPEATPAQQTHRGRVWLIAGLIVVAIAAAVGIGYLLGNNSRDDDVKAAQASAAAKASAAQDEQNAQAADTIEQGFNDLGAAISQEEAKDDQQAQQAVDDATNEIQSGFEQLGSDFANKLDTTLSDLKGKINEAVGQSGETSPAG